MSEEKRRPDYVLIVYDRNNRKRCMNAGGAWTNEHGYINISLAPGISVNYKDGLSFSLKPLSNNTSSVSSNNQVSDDDIPF